MRAARRRPLAILFCSAAAPAPPLALGSTAATERPVSADLPMSTTQLEAEPVELGAAAMHGSRRARWHNSPQRYMHWAAARRCGCACRCRRCRHCRRASCWRARGAEAISDKKGGFVCCASLRKRFKLAQACLVWRRHGGTPLRVLRRHGRRVDPVRLYRRAAHRM
jgi:hypothetical protein